jgi:hypothetical protein
LGGLIQKRNTGFVRKIPWLGDLPHIGFLFRFTQERELRQELMIIMTPHIVRSEAEAQRIKDTEVARVNWILNSTPEMHGDLGLSQGPIDSVFEQPIEMDPTVDPGMDAPVIQPMGGEEPASGPPADWILPVQPEASDEKSDTKPSRFGDKFRRAFRRS